MDQIKLQTNEALNFIIEEIDAIIYIIDVQTLNILYANEQDRKSVV